MERLHSQANQPNSACPYTLNGGVTALPCPFHHNHLSSTPLKLSTALPADNIPLCQPLRPAIKRINLSISAWWIFKKTTKWTTTISWFSGPVCNSWRCFENLSGQFLLGYTFGFLKWQIACLNKSFQSIVNQHFPNTEIAQPLKKDDIIPLTN